MVNVFSHLSLPQLSTVARRTALTAAGLGGIAVLGLGLAGYPLTGVGVCIGLALALGNFRMIAVATVKASAKASPDKRRPLVANTLGRLGLITVLAFGLVFLNQALGFGCLLGLAAFQFVLLANVTVAMLRDPAFQTPAAGADETPNAAPSPAAPTGDEP